MITLGLIGIPVKDASDGVSAMPIRRRCFGAGTFRRTTDSARRMDVAELTDSLVFDVGLY